MLRGHAKIDHKHADSGSREYRKKGTCVHIGETSGEAGFKEIYFFLIEWSTRGIGYRVVL